MPCCLNPACKNPSHPDDTNFCSHCGTPLLLLRNRYHPIKLIGAGGFGRTYLAEDIDKLNEKCVIKQFARQTRGTYALKKAKDLFEQEARQLQKLGEYPQIPRLLAYFEDNSCLYIVQEFIDGENLLSELKQEGIFSEEKIRDLLRDLLNVLQVVHEHKIVHRDIKPDNIVRRSSDRKLVLIDFGASKQLMTTVMPEHGTAIGSMGYVPMEQIEAGEAYPASDLYSLGATCFHLLSGILPWEAWKREGYNWVKCWRKYLQQPLSEELGLFIDKLLQQNYKQRYQSAEIALQELIKLPFNSSQPGKFFFTGNQPYLSQESVTRTLEPSRVNSNSVSSKPVNSNSINSNSINSPSLQTGIPTREIISPSNFQGMLSSSLLEAPAAIPSSDNLQSLHSLPLPKQSSKVKQGLTVVGIFILLSLGIYGIWSKSEETSPSVQKAETTLSSTIPSEEIVLVKTLTGHDSRVKSMVISPDGETLISASTDKTIHIWHLPTGKLKNTIANRNSHVKSIAISPDGNTLVSAHDDNTIDIWYLPTGQLVTSLNGHNSDIFSVVISEDGKTLASGSENDIKVWELATGKLQTTLKGHFSPLKSIALSPDGQTIVSASENKIKVWDLSTGELKTTIPQEAGIYSLAITPDNTTLISVDFNGHIHRWKLETGDLKHTLADRRDTVLSVFISQDGNTLVTGSPNSQIKIRNLQTGDLRTISTEHPDDVKSVAITPDGKTLISGNKDETIKIWRIP
ncbi:MAG: serine/threonine-protein kinase [Mastigocoleus sp. MO_167.B18]|nr:serine/threonine-protein kinase [Mastigocoleus sp. MO_167.B18]